MPNYSATAIANEFLRRRGESVSPAQMLVQKLAYIANGWNLAINGEPLIRENAEAWDNGPVYRSIWDHIRDFGYRGDHCTLLDPVTNQEINVRLAEQEVSVID